MVLARTVLAGIVLASYAGCSSTTTGEGPACQDFEGLYAVTGDCSIPPGGCAVRQDGCSGTLQCTSGGPGIDATFVASVVDFQVLSSECSATLDGDALEGTCDNDEGVCQFQALRIGSAENLPPPGGPVCGLSWSQGSNAACDSCVETNCCERLFACRPTTGCHELLACARQNCMDDSAACIAASCRDDVMGGAVAAEALLSCVVSACPEC